MPKYLSLLTHEIKLSDFTMNDHLMTHESAQILTAFHGVRP